MRMIKKIEHRIVTIKLIVGLLLLLGCASRHSFVPPPPMPDDTRSIPEPEFQEMNYLTDGWHNLATNQVNQAFDLNRQLRFLFGHPKQAMNLNAFDEVENSTWFTNRNAMYKLSNEEASRGPDTGAGPDTTDFWTITKAKMEGVTPGFHIKDRRGDRYVIKFDPPGFQEMATGAEVISTKLFYAMGYNVPENYITYFRPENLRLGKDVEFVDEKGRERLMNEADIATILEKVNHYPDGRYRALASRYVIGKPLGGFKFKGTWKNDPNDIIPHEYRRELRGLEVSSAWLKHFDLRAGNNFNTLVSENGRQYVKHYLLDFGSTLGSAANDAQPRYKGHENDLDPKSILYNMLTFGFHIKDWEKLNPVKFPSVGRLDTQDFNPGRTKPNYPNPAFENCTNLDGFWGAKLIMSLTDEQIDAIVRDGQYSDPRATEYIARALKIRRDISGRYWYQRVCNLDNFRLEINSEAQPVLTFIDRGIEDSLWMAEKSAYAWQVYAGKTEVTPQMPLPPNTPILLAPLAEKSAPLIKNSENRFYIKLKHKRHDDKKWSKWVKVFLEYKNEKFTLLGIQRQN